MMNDTECPSCHMSSYEDTSSEEQYCPYCEHEYLIEDDD